MRSKYIKGDEMTRFMAKFVKSKNGCWDWTAGLKDGYGAFRDGNKVTVRAHKWLWEKINGKTPYGHELDHVCNNRKCVNPDHLEPVTHTVNLQRALTGKRGNKTLSITHCPQGHEYTSENTYTPPSHFERQCRICRNERSRLWRQKAFVSAS